MSEELQKEQRKRRCVMERWEWALAQGEGDATRAASILNGLYSEDRKDELCVQHAEVVAVLDKVVSQMTEVTKRLGDPNFPLSVIAENLDHLEKVAEHIYSLTHIEEQLGHIAGALQVLKVHS